MARTTIGLGFVLIVLGLASYLGTGRASMTALIPSFFGLPLVVLGVIALSPARRKVAMHVAAVVGLLGLVGSLARPLPAMLDGTFQWSAATRVQIVMGALCAVYLVLCVKSFVDARRQADRA
ncbi:MAG: hypothetical protein ACYTGC_11310 [Planctomycetota bacterium]|jgi:hypothetical protein